MRGYVDEVRRERNLLVEELTRLGADPLPSEANFVFARFANAVRVWEDLQALGIAVRQWPDRAGLSDGLRIGCPGDPDDFSRLVSALRTVLRPEAVLFDMDGVLADESRSYREAIVETSRQFGVETSREEIRALKAAGGANNDWDVTLEIVRRAGVDVRREEVVQRFEAVYQGTGSGPGLCELEDLLPERSWLQRLARRYPLGIVTGRPRRDAEAFLRRKDIADLFGVVVTMDDAPVKPDPEPVRLALRRLGVESAWMIGDTPDDAAAARAAGVLPLGVLAPDPDDAVPAQALIERGCARILPELESLEELLP
jgi:HAD superfamily hydrolase (TIGR01548 family)